MRLCGLLRSTQPDGSSADSTSVDVVPVVEPCVDGGDRGWSADRFGAWVGPHWAVMSRLAARMAPAADRDDILQEALTSAWANWRQFDAERGSARSWLLAITANHARRAWRNRPPAAGSPVAADLPDKSHHDAIRMDIHRAVAGLAGRQRLAVELYYYLDLPVVEIAEVMGCSVGTVKSTLADSRRLLRTKLGEQYR